MYDPEQRAEMLKEFEGLAAKMMSPEGQARLAARGVLTDVEIGLDSDIQSIAWGGA